MTNKLVATNTPVKSISSHAARHLTKVRVRMDPEFWERLKKVLAEKGMSERELARACGLKSETHFSAARSSKSELGSSIIAKAAAVLEVSAGWLLTGEGYERPDAALPAEDAGRMLFLSTMAARGLEVEAREFLADRGDDVKPRGVKEGVDWFHALEDAFANWQAGRKGKSTARTFRE